MFTKIAGYLLAAAGALVFLFFRKYRGELIANPLLWQVLGGAVGLLGLFLVTKASKSKTSKQEKYNRDRLHKIKQTGERIIVTTDNSEIKSNSYHEGVEAKPYSDVVVMDALYDPERNYSQRFIEQSVVIYQYEKIKMISPYYPIGIDELTRYIENGQLNLFVNRFDKNDYVFELATASVS